MAEEGQIAEGDDKTTGRDYSGCQGEGFQGVPNPFFSKQNPNQKQTRGGSIPIPRAFLQRCIPLRIGQGGKCCAWWVTIVG